MKRYLFTTLIPALLSAALLQGCNSGGGNNTHKASLELTPAAVTYKTLHQGQTPYSETVGKSIRIVRNEAQYDKALQEHDPITITGADIDPSTDFDTQQILVLGNLFATGANTFKLIAIKDYGDYLLAEVMYEVIGTGCVGTADINTPFFFIEVDSKKRLLVEEKLQVNHCNN